MNTFKKREKRKPFKLMNDTAAQKNLNTEHYVILVSDLYQFNVVKYHHRIGQD